MTLEEFQSFKKHLLANSRIRSPKIIRAARRVLVGGETKADAARNSLVTPQAVGFAFKRINKLLEEWENRHEV